MHTGHSFLTHSFILKKREKLKAPCLRCMNYYYYNQRILIKCADLVEIRKILRRYMCIFRNVNPEKPFDFLREIGVFYIVRCVVVTFV